ncbi:mucin-3A-like, partial [Macrosteles quadrilineatus]|uniref:mucin-3A-like n=1 Tax=Macrosteles quadrilineatus TaxID=74068 RepID=UPI0023E212A7
MLDVLDIHVHGLALDFVHQGTRCNVLTVYRTHDSDLDNFTNALRHYYENKNDCNTYVFMGDTNANLLETDYKTERYLDVFFEHGFICGINTPTRVVGNSQTNIDHIFVNHNDYTALQTAVVRTDITDHYSICLQISHNPYTKDTSHNTNTYIDKTSLSLNIKECDWSDVSQTSDVNTSTDILFDKIKDCVNKSTKQRPVLKPRLRPLKPWITHDLVADEFNEYFANVGPNLAAGIDSGGLPVVDDTDHAVDSILTLHTVTEQELYTYVTRLRGGSAPGYDCVSAELLKDNWETLRQPLLHITNKSIQSVTNYEQASSSVIGLAVIASSLRTEKIRLSEEITTTNSSQFPYQAHVVLTYHRSYLVPLCDAVIINKRQVLTSASCLESDKSLSGVLVVAGTAEFAPENDGHYYNLSNAYVNPNYNSTTHYYDLVILETDRDFEMSVNLTAVELSKFPQFDDCFITSWWVGNSGSERYDDFLQFSQVKLSPKCQTDTKQIFCADTASYVGEIGSPLVCGGFLSGIESYYPLHNNRLLTNISTNYDWIVSLAPIPSTTFSPTTVTTDTPTASTTTTTPTAPPTQSPTTTTPTEPPTQSPTTTTPTEPPTQSPTTTTPTEPPTQSPTTTTPTAPPTESPTTTTPTAPPTESPTTTTPTAPPTESPTTITPTEPPTQSPTVTTPPTAPPTESPATPTPTAPTSITTSTPVTPSSKTTSTPIPITIVTETITTTTAPKPTGTTATAIPSNTTTERTSTTELPTMSVTETPAYTESETYSSTMFSFFSSSNTPIFTDSSEASTIIIESTTTTTSTTTTPTKPPVTESPTTTTPTAPPTESPTTTTPTAPPTESPTTTTPTAPPTESPTTTTTTAPPTESPTTTTTTAPPTESPTTTT